MEMLVPWNYVFAVVAVELWSMLSTAEVVNNFFLKTGGQTTHLPHTELLLRLQAGLRFLGPWCRRY